MRITVLTKQAKRLRCAPETSPPDVAAQPQRVKCFLWHGNVFRALQTVDDLTTDLTAGGDESGKLAKAVREFGGYLAANAPDIPNYGHPQLRGTPTRRRDHLHLVRRIRGQPGQQTHGQKAADAMGSPRRAPTAPDPHPGPQRHPRRPLPALVPRLTHTTDQEPLAA